MIYKHCYACDSDKPISDFWKNKRTKDGLQTQCKACMIENRETPLHKSKMKAYLHDYNIVNKERDRAKKNKYSREWYKRNPERRNAIRRKYYQTPNGHEVILSVTHKRVSKLLNSSGAYTAKQSRELLDRCNHSCLNCSSQARIELDHIIPVSLGGCNCISNIQPLCRKCNAAKGNRRTTDYRPQSIIDWANSFPHNHSVISPPCRAGAEPRPRR